MYIPLEQRVINPGRIHITKFQKTSKSTRLKFWDYHQQKASENNHKTKPKEKEHKKVITFGGKGFSNQETANLKKQQQQNPTEITGVRGKNAGEKILTVSSFL